MLLKIKLCIITIVLLELAANSVMAILQPFRAHANLSLEFTGLSKWQVFIFLC